MNSAARILFAIAAMSVIAAALGLLVEHFHLPQNFSSAGIGVAIGVGVALGALSLAPKEQSATEMQCLTV
jgi:hypothetical protein